MVLKKILLPWNTDCKFIILLCNVIIIICNLCVWFLKKILLPWNTDCKSTTTSQQNIENSRREDKDRTNIPNRSGDKTIAKPTSGTAQSVKSKPHKKKKLDTTKSNGNLVIPQSNGNVSSSSSSSNATTSSNASPPANFDSSGSLLPLAAPIFQGEIYSPSADESSRCSKCSNCSCSDNELEEDFDMYAETGKS